MYPKTQLKFKIIIGLVRFMYIGVKNDNEDYINDKIKIFNLQNFISIGQFLFSFIVYNIIGNYNSAIVSLGFVPGVLLGLYFMKKYQYTFAKIFLFIFYNLCIFGGIIYYSHPSLNYYYLPVLVALPMNFHYKELKSLIFLIVLTLSLFIIGVSPLEVYIPKMYADKTPDHSTLAILIIFITYVINLVIAYVIYTNISHNRLKKTSETLIKSRKKLIQQNIDFQSFSLASSQFLKSPIYVLNLFTDKIEKEINEGKKYEDLKEYFDIIQNSITNEEIFIDNLFDYNKIITSTAFYEKFELKAFLEEELNTYKKLDFTVNIQEVMIATDKELLRKIVWALFENSFSYNKNNTPKIEIYTIEYKKDVSIYFNDNGIGISDEFKDKIFEPFIRVNEVKDINGSGLGLTKAKKATEIINANLSLFNSSHEGSTFKLTLKKPIASLDKK